METETIITAAIFGALAGAIVAIVIVNLIDMRVTRQSLSEFDTIPKTRRNSCE